MASRIPFLDLGAARRELDGELEASAATLLPRVRIGRGALVAAGSVVTRDVEPETTVMGAPARPVLRQT